MGHKEEKIKYLFFENPRKQFQIREIARLTKIPKTTTERILKTLNKKGIIKREKEHVFPSYAANEESSLYKYEKKISIFNRIFHSGLSDELENELMPKCIVLFGSCAKGEYTKESDIDLFVQAKGKINVEKYEKQLNHKINLIMEEDLSKLSNELLNNIINGIKLRGYLKIK